MRKFFTKAAFIAAMSTASTEASAAMPLTLEGDYEYDSEYSADLEVNDPIEPVNRAIFSFNSVLDNYLIEPVARGYVDYVPVWGRNRVNNFLSNLNEPVNLVNSTLQAKDEKAFTALWRFIINTTFGLLGTFDAASEVGLDKSSESFAQTLYVWGFTESPYLVIPFLGPSTVRDGLGGVADFYANPFNYNEVLDSDIRTPIYVAEAINTRANLLPVTDNLNNSALDPYTTYRSAYYQNFKVQAEQ